MLSSNQLISLKEIFSITLLSIFFIVPSHAQQRTSREENSGFTSYEKVITSSAKTDEGLFKVHSLDDKYYFEIPDSLLGREILVVTRLAKTANGIGYGGEELNCQVIRWIRKDKKIFLRAVSYNNVANDSLPVAQSVRNSNFEPILFATEIKTISSDLSVVFEISNLLLKDVVSFGLDDQRRKQFKVSGIDENRTFIESVKSFPKNIEARNVITYKALDSPLPESPGTISIEINNSFILLPKVPMKPRLMDKRIGYFSIGQVDYGSEEQKAYTRTYIERWRIEPKDIQAYTRGELVEPKKQIIYYIDPATPKKWIAYIKQGAEDWNVAFEKAGFKNVIVARDAPSAIEDPDWSPEDVRYSVIRYYASKTENAYAPRICDPRSGEIIESDIGLYHNVMKLVREWYFVQTAAVNAEARKMKLDDNVMGQLIRLVISHEVGHSLGMAHNFAASHAYPVDSLRSASFTKTMGISSSIMDHVRYNYIAQPEDKGVTLLPRIGEYDKYAIAWGYSFFPQAKTADSEFIFLNKMITDKAGNPTYFYGHHTFNPIDPRSQGDDLGDNAMKAGAYGIADLKRIIPNLVAWSEEAGKDYCNLDNLYNHIAFQWNRYNGHVRANIGGIYESLKLSDQPGNVYAPVPKSVQKEAMLFLQRETFSTPLWLIDKNILQKFEQTGAIERIRNYQAANINALFEAGRLARLIEAEALLGKDTYTLLDLFTDMRNGIWLELYTQKTIDVYRRNLQRAYLDKLESLMKEEQIAPMNYKSMMGFTEVNVSQSDIRPTVRGELKILQSKISQSLSVTTDVTMRYHLEDCRQRIGHILEPK